MLFFDKKIVPQLKHVLLVNEPTGRRPIMSRTLNTRKRKLNDLFVKFFYLIIHQ